KAAGSELAADGLGRGHAAFDIKNERQDAASQRGNARSREIELGDKLTMVGGDIRMVDHGTEDHRLAQADTAATHHERARGKRRRCGEAARRSRPAPARAALIEGPGPAIGLAASDPSGSEQAGQAPAEGLDAV